MSGFFRRWNKVQWKVLISYQIFSERHQQSNIIIILSCAKVTFIRYLYQETALTSIMMPWWSSAPLYFTFTFPHHLSNFYFTFQKDVVDLHCIRLLFGSDRSPRREDFLCISPPLVHITTFRIAYHRLQSAYHRLQVCVTLCFYTEHRLQGLKRVP